MRRTKAQATKDESVGGILVSVDGKVLPLKGTALFAEAQGGLARVRLEQRFQNPYEEPLAVTYKFPLPADGAVSGFAFRIGEQRIVGEVDRKASARERYEEALIEGRTAGLVEQERSSLFTQELGNVPPKAEVVAELTVDQKLAWNSEGSWEWRFPTAVAPRYLGAPGRVPDAGKVTIQVADGEVPARLRLSLAIKDPLAESGRPESPSHPMRFSAGLGRTDACLADEAGAPLDRDVVVRWPVAAAHVGVELATCRLAAGRAPSAKSHGLLTVVPPQPEKAGRSLPRDLILLLDTSGSMSGEPLAQLQRIASALVQSLGAEDRLEMIEFSSVATRWRGKPAEMTAKARQDALSWIERLDAGGGTEMRTGLYEALAPLRPGAQRQVVLMTDGEIGFEQEVIDEVLHRLPAGSRLHTVGVGSAVNRSLTAPAARAGRGVEIVVGLGEDPERAAKRLLARTVAPQITELTVEGSALSRVAPQRLPDLFAGAPALISLELSPGGGSLVVRGKAAEGEFVRKLKVAPVEPGEGSPALAALFGRELVEDLETRVAAGERLDKEIEAAGLDFQISTRLTSWIAVSEQQTVDTRKPLRREAVPQQLPHGMSLGGLGLRAAAPAGRARSMPSMAMPPPAPVACAPQARAAPSRPAGPVFSQPADAPKMLTREGRVPKFEREELDEELAFEDASPAEPAEADALLDLAAPEEEPEIDDAAAKLVHARLVLRKNGELVLEVLAPEEGMEWDASARGKLLWRDGTELEVEVKLDRSTGPCSLPAGSVGRLVLAVGEGAPAEAPVVLRLRLAGREVVVMLDA